MQEGESLFKAEDAELAREIEGLLADNMTETQELMSQDRETEYEKLSKDERALVNECNLKYSNGSEGNAHIEGVAKGHQISIDLKKTKSGGANAISVTGNIDGDEITTKQALLLYARYMRVAKFQTFVESQVARKDNYEKKQIKEDINKSVEELLS